MLPDPFTIAAAAPTPEMIFSVVKSDGYGSERRTADGIYTLVINHEDAKAAERHYIRITEVKDAVNPYTGGTSKQSATVSIAMSFPKFGWTLAQKVALVKALTDTLADSEVTSTKILSFQS
jgi:hypothetical protein